jgi:hypothetical protein
MKPLLIPGFFLLMSFGLGCITTSDVSSNPTKSDYTFQKFNTMTQGEDFEIVLKNGKTYKTKHLFAQSDSTRWREIESQREQSVATVDISYVAKSNHLCGAIEGLAMGTTAAMAAAFLGNGGWYLGTSGIYGGIGGATLGLLIGAGKGHTSKYEFVPDSTQSTK